MAEGTTELKEQALATLQAGRRELSAEARWIRRSINPQRLLKNVVNEHPVAVLSAAFSIGVALAYRLSAPVFGVPKQIQPPRIKSKDAEGAEQVAKAGIALYLLSTAVKSAAPMLMKKGLRAWEQRAVAHAHDEEIADVTPEGKSTI